MKKLLLVLGFCLLYNFAFADVTAEILAKDIDSNGNIMIKTQYKIDGVEVESRYPKLDGKYYWVSRYNCINFANMNKAQIQERIDKDLKDFGEQLILKPIQEQQRDALKTANQNFYNTLNIVGHKLTVSEAKMRIDGNFDGKEDKELTVKSDGTKIEKDYTPSVTP